jgi:hypothetical protein
MSSEGPRFVWKFLVIALAIWATAATVLLITAGGGTTRHRPLRTQAPVHVSQAFMNAVQAEQEPNTPDVPDDKNDP